MVPKYPKSFFELVLTSLADSYVLTNILMDLLND